MSYARDLTTLYMRFYRAKRRNSNSILRPITIAARAILDADPRLFSQEGLEELVRGELSAFVERVGSDRAEGYFPRGSDAASRQVALEAFSAYFVNNLYYGALGGSRAALRGKQLNLLKNACEAIYREQEAKDWGNRPQAASPDPEEDSNG